MPSLLSVEGLSHRYSAHIAVQDVSFSLQKGEVVGFLGPNGAGKSTTMRLLAGVQSANKGKVYINGIDLHQNPLRAKACIGYLPEHPPVYPELTVDEYLKFCARLRRVKSIKQAVDTACERCSLQQVRHKLIRHLSKGYQQRTGIAQAILHQPALIILDEPTVGLDPNQIREIRRLIRQLSNDSGIILSTHILPEVQNTCSRVLILNQGCIVYDGSVAGQHPRYRIQLSQPMSEIALSSVQQLGKIETQNNGFLLTPSTAVNATELLKQLFDEGLAISGFSTDDAIESVYLKMTTGEAKNA